MVFVMRTKTNDLSAECLYTPHRGIQFINQIIIYLISIHSQIFDIQTHKLIYSLYKSYKQREMVEVAFDAMKNEMENDKTYLSDDDAVRGYFFIAFISLYIYFRVLEEIRKKGLTGKISVKELLFELSKVYLVNYSDGRKMLSEIPERVEKLAQTFELDIFPKTLRS